MNHWYDNTISQGILKEKYYHKGEKTPQEFMDRVSSIFDPELKKRIRGYLEDTSFCPAGRTLYAAGAKGKFKVSMSNCYILPSPEDNLESIFRANYEIARIFSYGGGIGINISNLRPKGSEVRNVARSSTGAVSFLKIFNVTGEVISQNGRRGAMMVGLNCSHPDIYEFLHIKQNEERLSSMNISILSPMNSWKPCGMTKNTTSISPWKPPARKSKEPLKPGNSSKNSVKPSGTGAIPVPSSSTG